MHWTVFGKSWDLWSLLYVYSWYLCTKPTCEWFSLLPCRRTCKKVCWDCVWWWHQKLDPLYLLLLIVSMVSASMRRHNIRYVDSLAGINAHLQHSTSPHHLSRFTTTTWASCQIRKIAGCACPGMPGMFSPPPWVIDPDMHHGTCVTHVPWCMSGSITRGFP